MGNKFTILKRSCHRSHDGCVCSLAIVMEHTDPQPRVVIASPPRTGSDIWAIVQIQKSTHSGDVWAGLLFSFLPTAGNKEGSKRKLRQETDEVGSTGFGGMTGVDSGSNP